MMHTTSTTTQSGHRARFAIAIAVAFHALSPGLAAAGEQAPYVDKERNELARLLVGYHNARTRELGARGGKGRITSVGPAIVDERSGAGAATAESLGRRASVTVVGGGYTTVLQQLVDQFYGYGPVDSFVAIYKDLPFAPRRQLVSLQKVQQVTGGSDPFAATSGAIDPLLVRLTVGAVRPHTREDLGDVTGRLALFARDPARDLGRVPRGRGWLAGFREVVTKGRPDLLRHLARPPSGRFRRLTEMRNSLLLHVPTARP